MKQRTYFASYSARVARGFPVRPDDLLVVEGRMGGEVLATNLVALQGQTGGQHRVGMGDNQMSPAATPAAEDAN